MTPRGRAPAAAAAKKHDAGLGPALAFELMLDEPFYQLMRQQLLAAESEKHGVADVVRVLNVLDPAVFRDSAVTSKEYVARYAAS